MRRAIIWAAGLAITASAAAWSNDPPELLSPVDCELGETCWVAQYPDLAIGAEARDPYCGTRTNDGHNGVDIAVRDLVDVQEGVAVLAAAPGRVTALRNGEPDRFVTDDAPAVTGRECGNGVVVDHGGGWRSQYCHLRRGSVSVEVGDDVEAGDRLGLLGYSGNTQFPHLHMSVRRDGQAVDPFTGRTEADGCGPQGSSLWADRESLVYAAATVSRVGFSLEAPSQDAAVAGAYRDLAAGADAPALVAWAEAWGLQERDELEITLRGPDGAVVARHVDVAPRDQARRFAFVGDRRPDGGWMRGTYTAEAVLRRDGLPEGSLRRTSVLTVD